ncbi:disease resistance protein Pik-1-like [Rhodamnia argentea]|uniref:Disease resistance protein Pik-1-like n=1 Tax=Rhodamnia argentea TaxID=178133 RepID=A0A8B8NAF1_9MYRT|nr:disease resistance protein Pik-1-like [Rhodamnia argentea]
MTKKKVVVKASMNGRNQKFSLFPNFRRQDNRLKGLRIATAVSGFQSLSLKGTHRDVIEVTVDGVDAVELTSKLRKSVGYANLKTVMKVKDGKEQEEKKPKKDEPPKSAALPVVWTYPPYVGMKL